MQFQPAERTVAGELERVLSELLNESIKISTAGRTDAGVHATGQVISFRSAAPFPFGQLPIAANSGLPPDVKIREAAETDERFSARFSAIERTYVYAVFNRKHPSALLARYAYHVWTPIDVPSFESAAAPLAGEHDFRSFCGALPESGPTVRNLRRVTLARCGDIARIEIAADGFLHRMARMLVGTLIECATGRRDPASMAAVLAAGDRAAAGHTAPPCGLYLAGVRYADGYDSFAEPPATVAAAAVGSSP